MLVSKTRDRLLRLLACATLVALSPVVASAAVIFSSDLTSATGFTVVGTPDTHSTFGFNYATVGVPQNSGADTRALRLVANNGDAIAAAEQIAVVTDDVFGGQYVVEFDMWLNYVGDLQLGGAGSTEFGGGVIGHDAVTSAFDSGANLAFTGDAGSGTDLRAHESGTLQGLADGGFNPALTGLNHTNIDAELGLFPSVAAPGAQLGFFPSQTGMTRAGAAGFGWRHYAINVDEAAGTAAFWVDGVHVATLDAADGTGFSGAGHAGFVYADFFSSITGDANVEFGLFDNLVVTQIPEPSTLTLAGLALLGLVASRRRK